MIWVSFLDFMYVTHVYLHFLKAYCRAPTTSHLLFCVTSALLCVCACLSIYFIRIRTLHWMEWKIRSKLIACDMMTLSKRRIKCKEIYQPYLLDLLFEIIVISIPLSFVYCVGWLFVIEQRCLCCKKKRDGISRPCNQYRFKYVTNVHAALITVQEYNKENRSTRTQELNICLKTQ